MRVSRSSRTRRRSPRRSAAARFARGAVVALDGSSSSDVDGSIATYAWTFGDGGEGSGALAEHIYNTAGTFEVALTVTDDDGASDTAALQIVIDDNEAPVALITAPAAAAIGENARFDGAGSSDADGTVSSFTWDFGDGTTGAGALFDKIYDASGSFTVTLTVTTTTARRARRSTRSRSPMPRRASTATGAGSSPTRACAISACCAAPSKTRSSRSSPTSATSRSPSTPAATDVPYSGALTGSDFTVANGQLGVVQTIAGSFTSATTFVGTYTIETGITDCAVRPVEGTKNP